MLSDEQALAKLDGFLKRLDNRVGWARRRGDPPEALERLYLARRLLAHRRRRLKNELYGEFGGRGGPRKSMF